MTRRYELSDVSRELVKDLVFPEQKISRPPSDDHQVLHGILRILCSALPGVTRLNDLGPSQPVSAFS